MAVLIDVSMPIVRSRVKNQTVKKTITLPAWLSMEAEAAHINFSQVLQNGLKAQLGLTRESTE